MRQFCTSIDSDRLIQGLGLCHSLGRHEPGAPLWVLCLDRPVEKVLERLQLPDVHPVPLAELESAEPTLRGARDFRSRDEYHLTATPAFLWHLLTRVPDTAPLTFVAPELCFFASPAALVAESSSGSIALTPRRFPPRRERLARYGRYDPGWITFLDDRSGREALAWWRNRCIEWCHARLEDGKFGAQKYLDDWTTRFQGVHVLANPGAGVAPWNVDALPVGTGAGGPTVGSAPLVFYHFHGFERISSWLYEPGLARYGASLTPELRQAIYEPYLLELRGIERTLRREVPGAPRGWGSARGFGLGALIRHALTKQLLVAR